MTRDALLMLVIPAVLLVLAQQSLAQEDQPDQRVAYAPDIVGVDRMFMIVLGVAAETPQIAVTLPDSVAMFDRTPLPTKTDQRRYYFRSLKPAEKAEIKVCPPETNRTTGSREPVSISATSMCPTAWFTGISGLPKNSASVLATTAPTLRQGPSPGPAEKDIASTFDILV